MLIDVQQLREKIEDDTNGNVKIFDCRFNLMNPNAGRESYVKGHIPNSQYIDLNKDLASEVTSDTGRHPLPEKELWLKKMQDWGIDEDSICILYDDASGAMAARFWWMLHKWNGLKNIFILDGGIQAWKDTGGKLSKDVYAIKTSTYEPSFNDEEIVDADFVAQGLSDDTIVLIDARSKERFNGEEEPIDIKAGHVPGSVNCEFSNNLDNGKLKSIEELEMIFDSLIKTDKTIVSMCGSGVTACHNIFTLALIDVDAKLYVGSWSEWIRDESRPIASA